MNVKAPWLKYYADVPEKLDYPDCSMSDMLEQAAEKYKGYSSYSFQNKDTGYSEMIKQVKTTAKAFKNLGIKENERVTICLPNMPQTLVSFYALNMIGAVSNMIHPLSSIGEIEFYIRDSASKAILIMDQFYSKFDEIRSVFPELKFIIISVADALPPLMRLGYKLTEGRKIKRIKPCDNDISWKRFLKGAENIGEDYRITKKGRDPAVILYSGGTTGTTKGILLSNLNFNAVGMQTAAMSNCCIPVKSMLAVMPMFHGFGLGVCIHAMQICGCKSILIPRFNAKSYAKLLKDKKPNYIVGVPTLYEAILRNPDMEGVDLSCLLGVFSGGDSLSVGLKKRFDRFLSEHSAKVHIREGYGMTECVSASCLTPYQIEREGSIGLPFPDTYYKIVKNGTTDEVPYGEEGEICLTGPTVMIGYINQPEETANVLKKHADGKTWLHTGDLGTMDKDGFVYYRQRIKRMIISSGYSIYPSQLENVIDMHSAVSISCVIGVPDAYKMQKVKAFVKLREGISPTEEIHNSIMEHCRKNISKYALPYEIEIREEFPMTLVGKVAYRKLEEEESNK